MSLVCRSNPHMWGRETKSFRIGSEEMSISLEVFFWDILVQIAERDGLSLSSLIGNLYQETIDEGSAFLDFSGFLRVCCGRFSVCNSTVTYQPIPMCRFDR